MANVCADAELDGTNLNGECHRIEGVVGNAEWVKDQIAKLERLPCREYLKSGPLP